jgi:hypothetical protein
MLDEDKALDAEAQKTLFIQQALDKAFVLQSSSLREYVQSALVTTGKIKSSDLQANNMQELLNLSHAIEVGAAANLSSRYRFVINQDAEWLHAQPLVNTDQYFKQRDEFVISLIDDGITNE